MTLFQRRSQCCGVTCCMNNKMYQVYRSAKKGDSVFALEALMGLLVLNQPKKQ